MSRIVDAFPRSVKTLDPVFITMSDGVTLAATIWLPEDAEADPVPAILELIPYRRRDGTVFRDMKMHPYVAGHGFACVRVDIRGSGDSEGVLADEYTEREQRDAEDIIAWLAAQSWCTGAVGMTGISWGGFNALQVAARRPPALKAVIALCCSDERYADDVHYFGGNLLTEDGMWSSFMLGMNALPPDPQIVGVRWRDMWRERLEAISCWSETWLRHQRRDAYWTFGSVAEDFSAIDIPVYAISGWDDTYFNAVPRLMQGLKGPKKGLIGPWSHAYPFLGAPGPAIHYLKEAIRWWRHWLVGEDTGIMEEPSYTVLIKDPHRPAHFYPEHPGQWVGEPGWPTPSVEMQRLYLNANGLAIEPTNGPVMRLKSPVTAGRDCGRYGGYGGEVPDMAGDQRREDGLGLCFETAELENDLVLLGAAAVDLELASDRPQATIIARLCEVWPDGVSTLITWGALNLSQRESREVPTPLVPGETVRARFELNHCGRRLARGNRLRLVLSNQHWPVLWPAPEMPTFTIASGVSALILPVRTAQPGDGDIAFEPAEISPPVAATELRETHDSRIVTIDAGKRQETLTLDSDYGRQRLEDRGIETWSAVRDIMAITEDDPLSARLETGWTLGFKSGECDAEATSRVTLKSTATQFHLQWRIEAREKNETIFTREGEAWIDRDHL
ncbi:putative CocE/NonD family hydrolase [Rhizobium sp. SG_E_25_P2]|uniref:CocE/NonD family hydrolase n=1 Tax=Rhizobium sp. SG_E_25_P2 TaxID=2879942 RepID=UPI0024742296|nr:CocE/NonD family hydrolase [Rhizobium sp. SG_E_25_P2]MDH6265868.1 putative CocE/NonD family hydrolase [Rhizobium sp. SG_E_25_P2]